MMPERCTGRRHVRGRREEPSQQTEAGTESWGKDAEVRKDLLRSWTFPQTEEFSIGEGHVEFRSKSKITATV